MGKNTELSDKEEKQFKKDYKKTAKARGLNPDPDAPGHKYDYRGAWRAGAVKGGKKGEHFPSKFKHDDHPNRVIKSDKSPTGLYDTKYERPALSKTRDFGDKIKER
jgi:hypothetical protein